MKQILIMSAILILVIVVLRAIFGKRMSMRLRYALWLLVAIRLLLPFQIGHSRISAANAIKPVYNPQPVVITYEVTDAPAEEPLHEESDFSLHTVWYAGMAVTALWFAAVNVRFYYRARKGAKRVEHAGLRIYISEGISSPCQIGFSIFLTPDVANDEERLRHVLAHEKTHFYHGDTLWSFLRVALMCVYWFFPPVWLAAMLSKQDCELACDEGALRLLGEEERFSYGRTLLSVAAQASSVQRFFCTATTMAQSKQELTARIKVIASKKKRPVLLTVLMIILVGVAAVSTFTGRTIAAPDSIEPPKQSFFDDSQLEMSEEENTSAMSETTLLPERRPTKVLSEATEPTEQSEEPTEETTVAPTAAQVYTQPQTEMPYEEQFDYTRISLPDMDVPDVLRSVNMAEPSENYEQSAANRVPGDYGFPSIGLVPDADEEFP